MNSSILDMCILTFFGLFYKFNFIWSKFIFKLVVLKTIIHTIRFLSLFTRLFWVWVLCFCFPSISMLFLFLNDRLSLSGNFMFVPIWYQDLSLPVQNQILKWHFGNFSSYKHCRYHPQDSGYPRQANHLQLRVGRMKVTVSW